MKEYPGEAGDTEPLNSDQSSLPMEVVSPFPVKGISPLTSEGISPTLFETNEQANKQTNKQTILASSETAAMQDNTYSFKDPSCYPLFASLPITRLKPSKPLKVKCKE